MGNKTLLNYKTNIVVRSVIGKGFKNSSRRMYKNLRIKRVPIFPYLPYIIAIIPTLGIL